VIVLQPLKKNRFLAASNALVFAKTPGAAAQQQHFVVALMALDLGPTLQSIASFLACITFFGRPRPVGWPSGSPFDGGKAIKLKENTKRLQFLTDDEKKSLLDACKEHLKPMVSCAILTGMRRGEIMSLKWDQVRNDFIYLDKTKTNEARQITISDALEAVFMKIRAKHGFEV
jgi:integrase